MELQHIADRRLPSSKQQYRDIEEDLLFVLDEKGHTVHLTDAGVDFMSPQAHDQFVLPAHGRDLTRRLDGRFHSLPGRHYVMVDDPAGYAAALKAFWGERVPLRNNRDKPAG